MKCCLAVCIHVSQPDIIDKITSGFFYYGVILHEEIKRMLELQIFVTTKAMIFVL